MTAFLPGLSRVADLLWERSQEAWKQAGNPRILDTQRLGLRDPGLCWCIALALGILCLIR